MTHHLSDLEALRYRLAPLARPDTPWRPLLPERLEATPK